MRRLLPGILLVLALPAHAAGPQVTDPTGDANGAGVVAPAPASLPAFDITSVRWFADTSVQRVAVTFADAPGEGRFALTWATPSCATNSLRWYAGGTFSYLEGCKPRHQRWYKPPVVSGRTMTFTIPRRELPSWVAAGMTLSKLGATAAPVVDARNLVLQPDVDTAYADVKYVVGS
jgi:hypothetical protein